MISGVIVKSEEKFRLDLDYKYAPLSITILIIAFPSTVLNLLLYIDEIYGLGNLVTA